MSLLIGIDHVVIAVRDLVASSAAFEDAGFSVSEGGRHEGFGTHNALVPLRSSYLELLSVEDPDAVASHGRPQQQALAALLDAGVEGPLAYVLCTDDVDGIADALSRLGIAAFGPAPMHRIRPDGSVASWRLLVPEGSALGRWFPYFIEWDPASLPPRGGPHPNGAVDIATVTVNVADPAVARPMFDLLGADTADGTTYRVGPHRVAFAPTPAREGLSATDVCGSPIDLLPACWGSGPVPRLTLPGWDGRAVRLPRCDGEDYVLP